VHCQGPPLPVKMWSACGLTSEHAYLSVARPWPQSDDPTTRVGVRVGDGTTPLVHGRA
jgi:hypothetical protein